MHLTTAAAHLAVGSDYMYITATLAKDVSTIFVFAVVLYHLHITIGRCIRVKCDDKLT